MLKAPALHKYEQKVCLVVCRQGCAEQQYPKVDWLRVQVRTATSKGAKPEDIVASYERWDDWVMQVQQVCSQTASIPCRSAVLLLFLRVSLQCMHASCTNKFAGQLHM